MFPERSGLGYEGGDFVEGGVVSVCCVDVERWRGYRAVDTRAALLGLDRLPDTRVRRLSTAPIELTQSPWFL